MFLRRKKRPTQDLLDQLKERPGEAYACNRFLACYAPGVDKFVVIPGNFTNVPEGECNRRLVLAMREYHHTM